MQKRFVPLLLLPVALIFAPLLVPQESPDSTERGSKIFQRRVLTSGLDNPWELTWGPDDMLWVTERTGRRVVRVDPESGEKHLVAMIDEVSAPGGQDGLLGMALHPDLLKGKGNDFVYVSYTYIDEAQGPDENVAEGNPYRYLYMKVVRYTYDADAGKFTDSQDLLTGLPAGNDHNSGRLKFGPDAKLYLGIGDHGHNQLGNYCLPIEAQRLPTSAEMKAEDYESYVGKVLRIDLDGSVPKDNPKLRGVKSHVYSYGHRNPQGLDFGENGVLYESEHGPKTDDEVNVVVKGRNYGWPHVAGYQDDKDYVYARWAEASTPCADLKYDDFNLNPAVPRDKESDFKEPFVEPLAALFTVESGYEFETPGCSGGFVCWPTVGISSIEHYAGGVDGIPGWGNVLLATTLKRGSLYVIPITASGRTRDGAIVRHFQTENRYRDTAVHPEKRTIYIATDARGLTERIGGGATPNMQDAGAILALTYEGEADGPIQPVAPKRTEMSDSRQGAPATTSGGTGLAPYFSASQAETGKTEYNANCAVCHGNTLENGTFGTPLAGPEFEAKWSGKTVQAFFEHAKTMPPNDPGSLPDQAYADVLAYIFEMNGLESGEAPLPTDSEALAQMTIP